MRFRILSTLTALTCNRNCILSLNSRLGTERHRPKDICKTIARLVLVFTWVLLTTRKKCRKKKCPRPSLKILCRKEQVLFRCSDVIPPPLIRREQEFALFFTLSATSSLFILLLLHHGGLIHLRRITQEQHNHNSNTMCHFPLHSERDDCLPHTAAAR